MLEIRILFYMMLYSIKMHQLFYIYQKTFKCSSIKAEHKNAHAPPAHPNQTAGSVINAIEYLM